MFLILSAAAVASAQDRPVSVAPATAQSAENRIREWSVLATNLEQRITRMLPCDPRVSAAIEEVSRASGARFQAVTAYWQEISRLSNDQIEAARALIASDQSRFAEWRADSADAEQEQARVVAQSSDLRDAVRQQAALDAAARVLSDIARSMGDQVKEAVARESASVKLDADLNEFVTAAQIRQTAIDDELKALTAESARWTAYYAARIARAQLECSITGSAADAPPLPKPARKAAK